MVESKTIGSEFVELAISSPRNFGERSFLSLKPRSQWNDGGQLLLSIILGIVLFLLLNYVSLRFYKVAACSKFRFIKWIIILWKIELIVSEIVIPFVIYEIIYKINNEIPNFNTL